MIISMTGYGRGSTRSGELEIAVEVRSVNNRFLDLALKVPHSLSAFEQQIRETVNAYLDRGRVSLWITVKGCEQQTAKPSINYSLAESYLAAAEELRYRFGLEGKIGVLELLSLPNILEMEEGNECDEALWLKAREALTQALEQLNEMRRREGEELRKDIDKR